jgi:hypothetical protein
VAAFITVLNSHVQILNNELNGLHGILHPLVAFQSSFCGCGAGLGFRGSGLLARQRLLSFLALALAIDFFPFGCTQTGGEKGT